MSIDRRHRLLLACRCALSAVVLSAVVLGTAARCEASAPVRRFAMVVGANSGGAGRVTLRYANSDATRISSVLRAYGGVTGGDLVVLREATPQRIREALAQLGTRIATARARHRRVELIFYYSGHSDERGLLPGGERMAWDELRRLLKALGADVRIAILDSCASGALIRTKGGKRRAPFLFDASSQVKGHAYLTSSSADEVAQESDRIGASYFTHHLVTGLRGAADMDQDHRVTLAEAYQYAFRRTLARTERTAKGPQHANYDFELAGSGDLVLTGLNVSASVLVFGKPTVGRFFIRDARGQLVAELEKGPGRVVELGLEPGAYRLNLHQRDRVYSHQVQLGRGGRITVDPGTFQEVSRVATRSRGGPVEPPGVAVTGATNPGPQRHTVAVDISVLPGLSLRGAGRHSDVRRLSLNIVGGLHHDIHGVEAGSVVNIVTGRVDGLQAAGVANLVRGEVHGSQFAGALNVAMGGVQGIQIAGGVNVAGDVRGVQIAGAVNLARRVNGTQLTSALNVTKDLRGLQVGALNIAGRSSGMQVGIINIATDDSPEANALGLLSFVRHGYNHIELWTSDTGLVNLGVKFGGKHMYTLIMAGLSQFSGDPVEFGLGWGGHFQLTSRLYLDIDALGGSRLAANNPARIEDLLVRARAALGLRIFGRLAVFAGIKTNVAIAFDFRDPRDTPLGWTRVTPETEQTGVNVGPGVFLGVRL